MGLGSDAGIAATLVARHPQRFGGLWTKDSGDVADQLAGLLGPGGFRKMPTTIDAERLDGGLDVAATLAASRPVHRAGLLQEAGEGLLLVPGAERLDPSLAGRIAAAMDGGGPGLLLLDGGKGDDAPLAACLGERVAFHLLTTGEENAAAPAGEDMTDAQVSTAIAEAAAMLGVAGSRADLFALRAARGHAALRGKAEVDEAALAFALRTVLAPRATRLPQSEPQPEEQQAPSPPPPGAAQHPLQDVVLEAVHTALPSELLASLLASGKLHKAGRGQGKAGRRASPLHGRMLGARAGRPGNGARLAILDTLRAAAPWQRLRGRTDRIRIAREDLRIRRHEIRSTALTVFAVDASGSAAAQRLAEAKGAVETLLQQSYTRRAEVALIAIRGDGATLLLPPTRSLTRARRLLAELPGGGGTPLAAGIDAARDVALAAIPRGRVPALVLLTDGRANIALDGRQERAAAATDATAAAKRVRAAAIAALVIDIAPRARPEASALAADMAARYLHLPLGQGSALAAAVGAAAA